MKPQEARKVAVDPLGPSTIKQKPLPVIAHEGEQPSATDLHPGSERKALTIADLEAIAFQHNPTLAIAMARIQAARGRAVQAGLYPNPVVGYHATEIGNQGTAGQQGAIVSQRFITGAKLRLDREIADKEVDALQFLLQAQEARVLNDVRARFYEAGIAQRRVELTRELVQIGDNLVTATKKLLEGRQGTENDVLQAEIRADNARILHENARNESTEAWRRLGAVIGIPGMKMHPLEGVVEVNLPVYRWEDCYRMVLVNHPELNAAKARVERSNLAIRRAKREPIPNVDVSVSVRHNNISGSNNANVQMGIPLPLFDRNQGNRRAAEAQWTAAQHDVSRIELLLQDRLAVAFRLYSNARQQATRYRERIVPRAGKSLQIVTNGYDKGQVEYLTLLTAQQTFVEVSLAHLDSLRELWASVVAIEGQLMSDSLAHEF